MTNKLYCFVDESGQDTKGGFFVVTLVITDDDLEAWDQACLHFEQVSGKGAGKWKKTSYARRLEYMHLVIESRLFVGRLAYAAYTGNQDYDSMKALTIARAVRHVGGKADKAIVIDGLRRRDFRDWGKRIRKQGVAIWKVAGANDENNSLIRLADAVSGLVRDALYDQKAEARSLFDLAIKRGILVNLG
jgi:hypothetical protein